MDHVLFSEEAILDGIEAVAAEVTEAYRGQEWTVVSILKGSCIFASDLVRRIPIPLQMAFVAAHSYGKGTQSGKLHVDFLPSGDEIEGRNILLVDDILDTGRTMHALKNELMNRGAVQVKTCVFLDKPSRRELHLEPDFRVFEVQNEFVVGYGLDFAGRYRNLPYVGALKPAVFEDIKGGEA
ncbi:hypoxanthine phosphoribosyltransferase [Candidatus Woesearchaeota archaeon]|nr:hypoxanthine phosphoribosyltransferase [Candidatus Woesearchaeota archaeon]